MVLVMGLSRDFGHPSRCALSLSSGDLSVLFLFLSKPWLRGLDLVAATSLELEMGERGRCQNSES